VGRGARVPHGALMALGEASSKLPDVFPLGEPTRRWS
jgi:hypothetical protein